MPSCFAARSHCRHAAYSFFASLILFGSFGHWQLNRQLFLLKLSLCPGVFVYKSKQTAEFGVKSISTSIINTIMLSNTFEFVHRKQTEPVRKMCRHNLRTLARGPAHKSITMRCSERRQRSAHACAWGIRCAGIGISNVTYNKNKKN